MIPTIHNYQNQLDDGFEYKVPTKLYDGRATKKTKIVDQQSLKKDDDSFLYYSIKENRMNALLGDDHTLDESLPSSGGSTITSLDRKTRISFEVHHSLILGDGLLRSDCCDDDIKGDRDISEDSILSLLESLNMPCEGNDY